MALFKTRTSAEHTRITADYLPNGWTWIAKRINDSNLYKLLYGLSIEFSRLEQKMNEIAEGWLLDRSAGLLETWEKTLGIPDGKIPGTTDTENRRRQTLMKLVSEGIKTNSDYVFLIDVLGIQVTVYPGYYFWLNPDVRVPTFSSEKEARFTLVIEADIPLSDPITLPDFFPVSFPWYFRTSTYNVVQQYLLDVIPANVQLIWITTEPGPTGFGFFPPGISAFGGTNP